MTRRFSAAYCAFVVTLALFLGASASAQDLENRCQELGSGCTCSETFNVYADLAHNPTGAFWNPPNSVTKPCGDNCSVNLTGRCGQYLYMTDNYQTKAKMVHAADPGEAPFPSGANPWIYKGSVNNIHHYGGDVWANVSNETICQREYRFFDENTPTSLNPDGSQRLKLSSIHIDQSPALPGRVAVQFSEFGSVDGHVEFIASNYFPDKAGSFPNMHNKCHQAWCRLEQCVDMSGNTLKYRVRMTYLADNTSVTATSNVGSGPTSATFEGGVGMFGQSINDVGRQYLSFYMQSRVPYNPNFWIGPASEVETGGGSSTLPPPPSPTAPVPPVLLQ